MDYKINEPDQIRTEFIIDDCCCDFFVAFVTSEYLLGVEFSNEKGVIFDKKDKDFIGLS